MSRRFAKLLDHRMIMAALAFLLVTGVGLFVFIHGSVTTFKHEEIRKNMTWMGNSITYICSSGHDQLARVGAAHDETKVLLKKAESAEMIEDFARNSGFEVVVYETAAADPLPLLSSFSKMINEEGAVRDLPVYQVAGVQLAGQQFNAFVVPFDSWGWRVVLLREATSYDDLLGRLRGFYLAFGALWIVLSVVILLCLRKSGESARALRESREELRSVLDSLAEGVIVIDGDGCIAQINPSAEQITGCAVSGAFLGHHIADVLALYHHGGGQPLPREVFEKGGMLSSEQGKGGEFFLQTHDDKKRLVQVRVAHSHRRRAGKKDTSLVLSLNDVTARRAIEKQLQQAQKMEVVGAMAGGVAHDLNNILSGIVSYPELVLLKLPKESDLRQPIEAIRAAGQRAAAVVADMLTVARGGAGTREVVSVNSLVGEYAGSREYLKLKGKYPETVFSFLYAPAILNISCSPVHVKRCILNLMLNAIEAMGGSGVCTVSTRKSLVGDQQAGRLQIDPGDYIIIAVKDSGPGISEDTIGHIFEPFYTKKKMGRSGTGLGLAVVWNTMLDHHGTVVVQSGKDGTVFELYFPGVALDVSENGEALSVVELQGHGELVLVIDDDPLQRAIATDFLVELNYEVESAASGEEAVEMVRDKAYDLLLLDMLMEPGINGRQAYERIIKIRPQQKALIASGYSESEDVTAAQILGAGQFVRKPYTLEQLAQAVQAELNK